MSEWHVAPGDPTHVFVGTAKPINCFSVDRAKLIAAAPDLLDVLLQIAAPFDAAKACGMPMGKAEIASDSKMLEKIRAAIAKATV